jgi:hypothetical protein
MGGNLERYVTVTEHPLEITDVNEETATSTYGFLSC